MKFLKDLRNERGSVLVLTALSFTMLVSFMAVAVDLGSMYSAQRKLQTLADAAAMAAALELPACGTTANCQIMQAAAGAAVTSDVTGNTLASTVPQSCSAAATGSGPGVTMTINNAPCLNAADPNLGVKTYVEVVLTQPHQTYFANIFNIPTVNISARAEAGYAVPSAGGGPGMWPSGSSGQTLTLNSGANITDATGTCGIQVNSTGTPAVMEDSGATVNVGSYNVVGHVTNNGGSYSPTPTTGAPAIVDPFTAEVTANTLIAPTAGTPISLQPLSAATTLPSPGAGQAATYAGFNMNGNGYTVTFQGPGIFVITGAIAVNSGITLAVNNATLYFAPGGSLTMNSNSNLIVTAPTTGPTAGLAIWQAAGNTNAMVLDSGTVSNISGGVYLPSSQLTLNGSSYIASYGTIVANTIMVNAKIALACSGGSGKANGSTTVALAE